MALVELAFLVVGVVELGEFLVAMRRLVQLGLGRRLLALTP